MEFRPSLEDVMKLAREMDSTGYRYVPVSTEIMSDVTTPINVLKILKSQSKHAFMLESVEDTKSWGRYTFLGYEPAMEITCIDGKLAVTEIEEGDKEKTSVSEENPGEVLRRIIGEHKSPRMDYLPTFTGGLVGYFAYDYIKYAEPSLRLDANDEEKFKDCDLMLFDKVIAFDNLRQRIVLIANVALDGAEENYRRAQGELEALTALVRGELQHGELQHGELQHGELQHADEDKPGRLKSEIKALFGKEEFCEMVERAKHHIKEGDIFQIVLSNRLEADYEGSMLNVYRVLRTLNPSPYMFYFAGTDVEVAGASPETLVKLDNGKLYTFPLAGTRARGKNAQEDEALEKELLDDPKELAEHNMLVDLGRNDIGRISEFGSVVVEKYHEIQRFSHVMHIGSTVSGQIREGLDAIDAVNSVLPAGTLSGAPKIRACQLINDLEGNKRGIYGGAIGYIDFAGNLDTCIAIRIAYKKNNKIFIRSGAGIVADSVPEKEYQECINKAAAVVKAIENAQSEEL